ncbi:MAG TPA: hypothetical protein VGF86_15960 [Candidatus Tumulicola sp.]|jgi:hypothetical protein
MAKKPLEPLIPLDEFKEFVQVIARVPKDAIKKAAEAEPKARLKAPRKSKNTAKQKT